MRRHLASVQSLESRCLLSTPGAAIGSQPIGPLTGKIIYTSGGHGFAAANTTSGNFTTGRGLTNGMVEDMGNQDQMTQFVYYAFNAGATVVPMRPVGYQPNEVVLDNASAGVSFSGAWSDGTASTFFSLSGPGVASRYRFANTTPTETAVARYTPTITVPGFYPVYAWASDGGNRVAQIYRVTHSGGKTEVKVDHRRVGKGWVYLGTYHFDAGTSGYVEISNKSPDSGVVIADAIRFGNGMGDIDRGSGISGQTREDEASLYWIQKQAENTYDSTGAVVPPTTYRGSNSLDSDANVSAPPRWAAYMNRESAGAFTDRLFVSFHSNAAGTRGTIGLYNGNNDPATKTPHQLEWALMAAQEVNDDLVALSPQLEFPWFNRTGTAQLTLDRSDIEFGEINNLRIGDEFDATIVEVAFHDNATDAALMRDPKVRQWIGRSTTQAAVRYFNTYAGASLNFAPDSPVIKSAITAFNGSGDVTLRWTAPVASNATGDAATGYIIETSHDGYGFDGGIVVAGGGTTSYTIPGSLLGGGAHYFRVIATNAGGASPPSAVVGAMQSAIAGAGVLVVNGFDRFDRTLDVVQDAPINGPGTHALIDRVRPRYSNSFDYVVQAGEAIEAYSQAIGFDSADNQAIIDGTVQLSNYAAVIWLSGEESTADHTFSSTEQSAVAAYVSGGGRLFVSGSEIGWDLDAQGAGASFYNNTLKADYVSDDAGTYNVTGVAGSIFAGLDFSFDNGAQFYDVNFPDRITSSGGSTISLNYVGGTGGGAGIQWTGAGTARVVTLGFPFETITTAANRAAVMSAVLGFFGLAVTVPAPAAPDLAAGYDTGYSATDDLTRLNNSSPLSTLQFTVGNTVAGLTVKLFSDDTLIGSAVATGTTTTISTSGAFTLADGTHQITARQEVPGGASSSASPALPLTVDTTPPALVVSTFIYQDFQAVAFTFDSAVAPSLDAADLTLVNLTTSQTIPAGSIALDAVNSDALARFVFPGFAGGILPDGNYRATIAGSSVADIAGNLLGANQILDFFVLAGDANRDRVVDITDLSILATNWQTSPRLFSDADFNYDDVVDITDLSILATNWQKNLPAPAPPVFKPSLTTRKVLARQPLRELA